MCPAVAPKIRRQISFTFANKVRMIRQPRAVKKASLETRKPSNSQSRFSVPRILLFANIKNFRDGESAFSCVLEPHRIYHLTHHIGSGKSQLIAATAPARATYTRHIHANTQWGNINYLLPASFARREGRHLAFFPLPLQAILNPKAMLTADSH